MNTVTDLKRPSIPASDWTGAIVIIGAGRTGRGFVARLVHSSDRPIVFIDRDEHLVQRLNATGWYTVYFFGNERPPVKVDGYRAVTRNSAVARDVVANADMIFTAVGGQNLKDVAALIGQSLRHRSAQVADASSHSHVQPDGSEMDDMIENTIPIFTCENATRAGQVLRDHLSAMEVAGIKIAEAAIFCTTVESKAPGCELDIFSENFDDLPYDGAVLPGFQGVPGMAPVDNFPQLLLRKIYTYNCISACIAYLGANKGYSLYADAANDEEILQVTKNVMTSLNRVLSAELSISLVNQTDFSNRALAKFQNRDIHDDIERNARDVCRKLSQGERLVGPALLFLKHHVPIDDLVLVMVRALQYGYRHEKPIRQLLRDKGPNQSLAHISDLGEQHVLVERVASLYLHLEAAETENK